MRLSGFFKSGCAALAVALLAGGCAQTVGDINRVQPGYQTKTVFASEHKWYVQETVTRVDNNMSGAIFDGYVLNNDKIRWKLEEDRLLAYRTYENIPGENYGGNPDQKTDDLYFGSPVAIFAVTSHFDIRREYNPATGEQSNVLSENVERPWFEREYVRIDWSKNLVPSINSIDSNMASLSFMPATSRVYQDTPNEASNPRRLRVSDEFIQIPTTYLVNPDANYCFTLGVVY